MLQKNGDTIPVMVIGTGFTQDSNSTYSVGAEDLLFEAIGSTPTATATFSY